MSIYLIAGIVCAIAFVLWLIGVLRDGRKERRRVREFQQDIARQERTYRPIFNEEGHSNEDDDTALILPGREP